MLSKSVFINITIWRIPLAPSFHKTDSSRARKVEEIVCFMITKNFSFIGNDLHWAVNTVNTRPLCSKDRRSWSRALVWKSDRQTALSRPVANTAVWPGARYSLHLHRHQQQVCVIKIERALPTDPQRAGHHPSQACQQCTQWASTHTATQYTRTYNRRLHRVIIHVQWQGRMKKML